MTSSNFISKVAIVGGGGNVGRFITEFLLKTGKHSVTALTRDDSQNKLPQGVNVARVDYSKPKTLVAALRGHDALVITLSGSSPKDTEQKLIEAAGEAGVDWILPNEWAPDTANEALVRDVFIFQSKPTTRQAIVDLGQSSFISVSTGFWYEWSLAVAPAFGFDFANRAVTMFDEGETRISVSTWPQIGRAVAALLSLPVKGEGSGAQAYLEKFKNKVVYVSSFSVNQQEILDSVFRVTGTTAADWVITKESSHERYMKGLEEIKEGQKIGFAKMMYTRLFFPDGCGDPGWKEDSLNNLIDLPKEDMDAATERAIERSKRPQWV